MSETFLLDQRSLTLCEEFVSVDESVQKACDEALLAGMDALSRGATAALTFAAQAIDARNIVEIGTGNGESGLAFFSAMGSEGMLTTIDTRPDRQDRARQAFKEVGIAPRQVRLIPGNPLEILNNLRDSAYDIVFINGDKLEYVEHLAQAERLLRPRGLVIINDALWHNLVADPRDESDESVIIRETLESMRSNEAFTPLLIPLGEGLLFAVRN